MAQRKGKSRLYIVCATHKHENLVHTCVGLCGPGAAMLGTPGTPQSISYIFMSCSCSVIRRMDVVRFVGESWTIFGDDSHHLTMQTRI